MFFCESFSWHDDYKKDQLNVFLNYNKPDLFFIAANLYDVLNEGISSFKDNHRE